MSQEQVNKKTLVNKKNGYVIHLWGRPQDVGPYEINLSMTNKPIEIVGYATSLEGLKSSIHNMVYTFAEQGYELVEYNLRPEALTLLREHYPENCLLRAKTKLFNGNNSIIEGTLTEITEDGMFQLKCGNLVYPVPFANTVFTKVEEG